MFSFLYQNIWQTGGFLSVNLLLQAFLQYRSSVMYSSCTQQNSNEISWKLKMMFLLILSIPDILLGKHYLIILVGSIMFNFLKIVAGESNEVAKACH